MRNNLTTRAELAPNATHGDLAPSPQPSCEHQPGEIEAGQKQHAEGSGEECNQRCAGIANDGLVEGQKYASDGLIGVGVFLLQRRHQLINLGLCLVDARTNLQACRKTQKPTASAHLLEGEIGGYKQIYVARERFLGHHADHRVRRAGEFDGLAESVVGAVHLATPERVTDQDDGIGFAASLDSSERTAQPWLQADDFEEPAERAQHGHPTGVAAAGEHGVLAIEAGNRREGINAGSQIAKPGRIAAGFVPLDSFVNPHALIGVGTRDGSDQCGIYHREDRRGGSHAECQERARGSGEGGALAKLPLRDPDILQESIHCRDPELVAIAFLRGVHRSEVTSRRALGVGSR